MINNTTASDTSSPQAVLNIVRAFEARKSRGERGLNISHVTFGDMPLLHFAAFTNDSALVMRLALNLGVNPLFRDRSGQMAVHIAAREGHAEALEALLIIGSSTAVTQAEDEVYVRRKEEKDAAAASASPPIAPSSSSAPTKTTSSYYRPSEGWRLPPIALAASNGHTRCIQLLADAGADPLHDADKGAAFALYYASRGNHVGAVKVLLAMGTPVNWAKTSGGVTCLYAASSEGRDETVAALLADPDCDIHEAEDSVLSPLGATLMYGHYTTAKLLLEAGCSTKPLRGAAGDHSLHIAMRRGDLTLMRLIVDNGASLEDKDSNGMTPLQIAALGSDNEHFLAFLLAEGVTLNDDLDAIVSVCSNGGGKKIQMLISAGLKVNQRVDQNTGRTPLHIAVTAWNSAGVMALLAAGADVNAVNANGQTPLQKAIEMRFDGIARVLRSYGAKEEVT